MLVLIQHPLLLCSPPPCRIVLAPIYLTRLFMRLRVIDPSCAKVLIGREPSYRGGWRLGGGLEFRGLDSLLLRGMYRSSRPDGVVGESAS